MVQRLVLLGARFLGGWWGFCSEEVRSWIVKEGGRRMLCVSVCARAHMHAFCLQGGEVVVLRS